MFRNYFRIAWRKIIKDRFVSAVNIIGLSSGIAFSLLIAAYVWTEMQVNTDLKNADRQFIIQSKWKNPNQGYFLATLGPLGKALKESYPGLVANYYRFDGITSNVSKHDKSFRENLQVGDSTLLTMYGFPLLYGDPKTALKKPFATVLTAEKARKYFGRTNVVGETITIESFSGTKHEFIVTGVLKELPRNSVTSTIDQYPGAIFVSTLNLQFFGRNMDWQNPYIVNFIELRKGVRPKDLELPIARLIKLNGPAFTADLTPEIISLRDFYVNANNGLIKKMTYALSAIALFILVMAVINFINMSVSSAGSRMKEIGIRKVLGSRRKQLVTQFLVESIVIVLIATIIAFAIYAAIGNLFSSILLHAVPPLTQLPFSLIALMLALIVVVGFIAGIYPAFVLSFPKPVESLKGKATVQSSVLMRKSLVAFQFVIAIIAFTGAMVISKQINLFLSKDLGYNRDFVVSAQLPRDWTRNGVEKMKSIGNEFEKMPAVKAVSLSYEIPDGNNSGASGLYKPGQDSSSAITTQALTADEHFLNVYQIPIRAGSFFEGHGLDSGKVIINEAAVAALGWNSASEAVGQQVRIPGDPTVFEIKGVTNDFHFGSMQQKVAPIVFLNVQFVPIYRFLSFKLAPGNISGSLESVQHKWALLMPGTPFEYTFMDDTLAKLYGAEIQLKKASVTATVLALTIVLLGVVGLISLSVQKRIKEIGIRKVLGSSIAAILFLFMKEFIGVMLVGGLIACPLTYLIMQKWLQGYAYRVPLTATPFIISIAGLGSITALLIAAQTIKTALANPVKSLRVE